MKKKEKHAWSAGRKAITGGIIAVVAVALFFAARYVYLVAVNPISAFPDIAKEPEVIIDNTPAVSATSAPSVMEPEVTVDPEQALRDAADISFMKNRVNVLFLGLDESAERANWGSFRTDTMIVVSVDFETKDVYLVSIPRDSYIKIYGKDERAKANSAFVAGGGSKKNGYEYAGKTASMILGNIPINYYIGINMQAVKDVVDAMGGVDYVVDIDVKMNGRVLTPAEAPQRLNGQQVLDYCRQRHGSSDIARVDRQQRMLFAIFAQLKKTRQIANIPAIFQAVEKNLETNLSFTQISALALLATGVETDNLHRYTLPGQFLNMRKTSYWGVSEGQRVKMVKEVFGVNAEIDPSGDVNAIKAELEANRARIAGELSQASSGIAHCKELLANYASTLTTEHKNLLNAAIKKLQDAYDAEDQMELLDAIGYYQSVAQYVQSALGLAPLQPQATEAPGSQTLAPAPVETAPPTPPPTAPMMPMPSAAQPTADFWVPPVN